MIINYVDCIENTLLKDQKGKVLTHKFLSLPFRIQKITLSPKNEISTKILSKAKSRFEKISFNVADSSGITGMKTKLNLSHFVV